MVYEANTIIKFGKHKGRILEDVICGITAGSEESTTENYLNDLFEFLSNDSFEMSVNASSYILDDDFNEFLKKDLSTKNRSKILKDLKIISNIIILPISTLSLKKIKDFIHKLLEGPFIIKTVHRSNNHENLCLSSLAIKPDISYISWAIKNVKDFIVDPNFLNQSFNCGYLDKISATSMQYDSNDFLYHVDPEGYLSKDRLMKYKPIIKTSVLTFSDETKEVNRKKLETLTTYFPDEPVKYGSSYHQYGGPNFDGSDLDDDFINDALDGDPNNYWNID